MSRFFRKVESTDSSAAESEDSDDTDEEISEVVPGQAQSGAEAAIALRTNDVERLPPNTSTSHRDLLLAALLEERCTNDVMASYSSLRPAIRPDRNSPAIQRQGRAKFQRLSAQLQILNLVPAGLEDDQHASTRQRYREGLDLLSQQGSTAGVPSILQRVLTDTELLTVGNPARHVEVNAPTNDLVSLRPFLPIPVTRLLTDVGRQDAPSSQLRALVSSQFNAADRQVSRYAQEFEEIDVLGRGGYGVVYRVKHRLDNQLYAIKQVQLSKTRLQRLQQRGRSAIDEVLRELRTLARLDHPNVVRYYTGWVEWIDNASAQRNVDSDEQSEMSTSTSVGALSATAEETSVKLSRKVTMESDHGDVDVVFEDSNGPTDLSANLQSKKKGIANQTPAAVPFEQSGMSAVDFEEPTLVVHMQMSLHPMSLADYLAPTEHDILDPTSVPPLAHCFHAEPSIAILKALLEGIEYIHGEGIVHRDIKPGNIFLGRISNPRATRGSVDLLLCSECRNQGWASPIRLEVRIGDFGLVSVAHSDTSVHAPQLEAIGTEIYRPVSGHPNSPGLDIYALGIVAFELLWKFNTRSERIHTLLELKEGNFPAGFAQMLGKDRAAAITDCIKAMMANNGRANSISDIRRKLQQLLG